MKEIHIKNKLKKIGMPVDSLSLGDFDSIGHFTAYKDRAEGSELYRKVGRFFRPNYERGLLIYSLIKKHNLKSYLEIGFGRGYSALCAAKALEENGGGKVTTVDPAIHPQQWEMIQQVFPKPWVDMITIAQVKSQDYLVMHKDKYDFIYIDGDHTYDAVKEDWENCKDRYNNFLLFDDYHKTQEKEEIQCSKLIDEIEDDSKELIIMDRRIFFDDRRIPDKQIDYGQVLLTK